MRNGIAQNRWNSSIDNKDKGRTIKEFVVVERLTVLSCSYRLSSENAKYIVPFQGGQTRSFTYGYENLTDGDEIMTEN